MIQTFSSTIRRKEMDAVLTCMVDEKIGPGELNVRLIQAVKDFFACSGAVALRSPAIALRYALKALDLPVKSSIMISALAPAWQLSTIEEAGYVPLVLDVDEITGLVTPDIVSEAIKNGGRLLVLHETMGIMPDMRGIMELGIPVIEDISQSAGAVYTDMNAGVPAMDENSQPADEAAKSGKKAGMFGVFSILGLEEYDIITGGGGAVLMAPGKREWVVLKKIADTLSETDLLPDINSALACVQMKEYQRNEAVRKDIFTLYQRSLLSGKNKTYIRAPDEGAAAWSFPVIIAGSFKDVKQYALRKEIEIRPAYEHSVISRFDEDMSLSFRHAKSLLLRCVLFPLYPRLGKSQIQKIARVLGTLP